MALDLRKHLDHQSPDWVHTESIYFITVCAEPRNTNHFCTPLIGANILNSISYCHEKHLWFCHLAVLMPDHVHLLLSFPDGLSFSRAIGDWKRWLAGHHDISWQENFFDHRLRKEESLDQKARYILQNPVRAGLVSRSEDWPYIWMPKR